MTVASVASSLLFLLTMVSAAPICPGPDCGGGCIDNSDCNCDSTQELSSCSAGSGAGGFCFENADGASNDLCVCNPGFLGTGCASGDTDGDGVSDFDEDSVLTDCSGNMVPDRDCDGIDNSLDFDPTGYFYDQDTGEIIAGVSIAVLGPPTITILHDGSNGFYQFIGDAAGENLYTVQFTLPAGYAMSQSCPAEASPFDAVPGAPVILGADEDGSSGFLVGGGPQCTTWYASYILAPGDQLVLNSNVPLRRISTPAPVASVWGLAALATILLALAAWQRRRRDPADAARG